MVFSHLLGGTWNKQANKQGAAVRFLFLPGSDLQWKCKGHCTARQTSVFTICHRDFLQLRWTGWTWLEGFLHHLGYEYQGIRYTCHDELIRSGLQSCSAVRINSSVCITDLDEAQLSDPPSCPMRTDQQTGVTTHMSSAAWMLQNRRTLLLVSAVHCHFFNVFPRADPWRRSHDWAVFCIITEALHRRVMHC